MAEVINRPVVLSVNQDKGISPQRAKGAAVHLTAMREAFTELGTDCRGIDEADDRHLLKALHSQLSKGPVDLIYERYALGKSVTARFAKEYDIPLVIEVNAPLADEQSRWRGGSDEPEDAEHDAFTLQTAARVIAVSNEVGRYAVGRGANVARLEVCPNGIDVRRFNLACRRASHRQGLVPAGRFVIGFHGRLRPWHGFDMLVGVCTQLLAGGFDIHLLVVGEGEFDVLEQLPADRYSRIPWQAHDEIPKYVAAFDALPLTYQADMPCYFSPLKLMEAMACGVVPLVPDLGDLPEVVKNESTGLVYRAGDSGQLQAQLESLITNKEFLEELGKQAGRQARQHSWTRIAALAMESAGRQVGLMNLALQDLQHCVPDLQQVRRVAIGQQAEIHFEVHTQGGHRFYVYRDQGLLELQPEKDSKIPLAAQLTGDEFAAKHKIISYRPGRRMVISAQSGAATVFVKGYKKHRAGIAIERFKLAASANLSGGFDVPKLLRFEQGEDFFVMAQMPGQAPVIDVDVVKTWQEIGTRLRHFQQSVLNEQLQVFDFQQELDVLDERARRFLLCVTDLSLQWQAERDSLTACSMKLPPVALGLAHRDLHDGQFVINDTTVGLLDFDLLSRADVALDAGNLLAHLQLRALQQDQESNPEAVISCSHAFLKGLNRQHDPGFIEALLFYKASTFLRLALLYAIRPRWKHLTPALIAEGRLCINRLKQLQEQAGCTL